MEADLSNPPDFDNTPDEDEIFQGNRITRQVADSLAVRPLSEDLLEFAIRDRVHCPSEEIVSRQNRENVRQLHAALGNWLGIEDTERDVPNWYSPADLDMLKAVQERLEEQAEGVLFTDDAEIQILVQSFRSYVEARRKALEAIGS